MAENKEKKWRIVPEPTAYQRMVFDAFFGGRLWLTTQDGHLIDFAPGNLRIIPASGDARPHPDAGVIRYSTDDGGPRHQRPGGGLRYEIEDLVWQVKRPDQGGAPMLPLEQLAEASGLPVEYLRHLRDKFKLVEGTKHAQTANVFADWLDENGHGDAAAALRKQFPLGAKE